MQRTGCQRTELRPLPQLSTSSLRRPEAVRRQLTLTVHPADRRSVPRSLSSSQSRSTAESDVTSHCGHYRYYTLYPVYRPRRYRGNYVVVDATAVT